MAINPRKIEVVPATRKFSSKTRRLTTYLSNTVASPSPIGGITIAKTRAVSGKIPSAASQIAIAPAALLTGPPKSNAVKQAIIVESSTALAS